MKRCLLIASLLFPTFALSDQVSSFKFKGVNLNENSVIIDPSEAQDLLNVDVTPGGSSVKKRSGYGLYKALATGKPIHGIYHGFDSTGNDVQIVGSSTSLYGIVSGGTPTQLISSATLNAVWDCTDSQGSFYCVNSNRSAYIKTSGATMTWYSAPLGTMVMTTPDRVVVAGVSGNANTLYFSQSNTFTNYVVGINSTDPFNEIIASPGSKLTHITWGCGKLLWWKDQSMGSVDFEDQFNVSIQTLSDTIGTFDNTSAIDPGGNVWFRGQDGHTYKYDCSFITKESIEITPNTQVTGNRVSNSWSQTTASDFNAGVSTPSLNVSTNSSLGDVVFNGVISTETSSAKWSLGTTNDMNIGASSITLATNNSGTVQDNGFENMVDPNCGPQWSGSGWPACTTGGVYSCNPRTGSAFAVGVGGASSAKILDTGDQVLATTNFTPNIGIGCGTWTQATISSSGNIGKRFKLRFTDNAGNTITTASTYILGGDLTFYYNGGRVSGGADPRTFFDDIANGSSTIATGNFTSQMFDLGFAGSTIQLSTFNFTQNSSIPTFSIITAASSGGPYSTLTSSTNTWALGNRYVRYTTTVTVTSSGNALTAITAAVLARSTGTYYSAVNNSPNLTSWNTLGVSAVDNGGSHSYFVRGGTNAFSVLSATPTWTAITAGSLIEIATGTYTQFRDDFSITYSSQTPTLNEFTINWFEGSSTDQAYMLYFNDAIWESVAFGGGQTTNNYTFKRDLINDAWTFYNFGAGGMLVQSNELYFGDTSSGNVFIYGTGTSDNGTAINAFWKSKDFSGQDPFLQNQLNRIDLFCKKDQGTTLTATYTTDTSSSTAYSVGLSTSSNVIQNRKLLPTGKLGYSFNLKLSDTSTSSAWECFGYRADYSQLPYRPSL